MLSRDEACVLALDCEMVGVGSTGSRSALAQVVLVDWAGRVVYSAHVTPKEEVTDYRTAVSGITREQLLPRNGAKPMDTVAGEVAAHIRGRVLVGHGLRNDLHALLLKHPRTAIRDTSTYAPLCRPPGRDGKARPKRLQALARELLGVVIQDGTHDPAEDARAALAVYKLERAVWESTLRPKDRANMRAR